MSISWEGRVAVVTGAASGIGMGLVKHCLSERMHVFATDVDENALAALMDSENSDLLQSKIVDVSDMNQMQDLAQQVFAEFNEVNLLFNNAGVLVDGKSWQRPMRDWRWIVDVNVMGVIHGISSFLPLMLEQGTEGRVINTSSVGGLLGGGAFMAPYQATKHFVTALTESLYQELQMETDLISASLLCPGEVATGIWSSDRLRPDDKQNQLTSAEEAASHDAIAQGVAAGLDPREFAKLAFAEIESGKFWLLPQPAFKKAFALRCDSVIEGTDPPSSASLIEMMMGARER